MFLKRILCLRVLGFGKWAGFVWFNHGVGGDSWLWFEPFRRSSGFDKSSSIADPVSKELSGFLV